MSYGNEYQETLRPGILITSKVSPPGGTLGCFARLTSDPSKIVLLSNSHVLYGDVQSLGGAGAGDGADVGQPSVSCCWCCACRVIAANRTNAFTRVTVNVTSPEASTETGSEIDCAIAILNDDRPYTNEALYGMITGTPNSGFGVSGGDAVEMVGSTSGRSSGTVLSFTTTATLQNGTPVPPILFPYTVSGSEIDDNFAGVPSGVNQLLIAPDPNPQNSSQKTHFCGPGDSGSVIVNSAKQVVGLLSRAWQPSESSRAFLNARMSSPLPDHVGTLGLAAPIGAVLSALQIQIDGNMSGTAPSAGASLVDLKRGERRRALQLTLRDLEREIRTKALGRTVMDAIARHRGEVLSLVNNERRVAVAWRRSEGPAFAAHCLRSLEDHEYVIPSDVHGVTPRRLIEKMAAVLKRYGSDALRRDIEAYERIAFDWIVDTTSVWPLVERMKRLEPLDRDDERATEVGSTEYLSWG